MRLVVPFAVGGTTDLFARALAERLAAPLAVPVLVENRPGANGNLGTEAVARALPDGRTLLVTTNAAVVVNPLVYRMSVDPRVALVPLGEVSRAELVLAVAAAQPWRRVEDLVEAARRSPGALGFASVGNGSLSHLAGELFAQRAGVALTHVPYKGAAPALTDLLGGQVAMYFGTPPTFVAAVKAGTVRLLASTGTERSDAFPDVPRLGDTLPGFEVSGWTGVFAPRGTPAPIIEALWQAIDAALASPQLARRLAEQGFRVSTADGAALAARIAQEGRLWEPVVRAAGLAARQP